MSVLALPPEITETIIVWAVVAGFPTSIASLARTCRHHRAVVYNASGQHLWREIYLVVFDDPRERRFVDLENFDWGAEFRQRIWTERYLRRYTQPLKIQKVYNLRSRKSAVSVVDLSPTYNRASSLKALEALLSVIKTAAPTGFLPSLHSPAFPLTHAHTLTYAHIHTSTLRDAPSPVPSLNITWLATTLAPGLPPALVTKLSGEHRDANWDNTPEALALARLVCCIGFLPVREFREERTGRLASSTAVDTGRGPSDITSVDMSVDAQERRARCRARERVYTLSFLTRRRHWGPYLPVPPSPPSSSITTFQTEPGRSAASAPNTFWDGSDSDSSSDSDYIPADNTSASSGSVSTDSPPEQQQEHPDTGPVRQRKRTVPTSAQLSPDWTWLAAARIVCEANIREQGALDETQLAELCSWERLREGAWIGERKESLKEDTFSQRGSELVNEKEPPTEVKGWDWAGVEGVHRRCVSWLDYTDLIHHNVHSNFDDRFLEEAMIIVPLRLRAVGYEPCTVPGYSDRPTIKVEGEMGGAGWTGVPDGVGEDIRRLHGTVGMIADGSVRWSIYSSDEDLERDQWASEGIQIGGVGSAMGVLGMWTGAFHESADPLGPFWQWRVA
ncbi:hypothetical protein AcW1_002963 [Taiwanofungus camphoratus]|nr:hypothetical protein AcW1_002963 [Antrodia cinnamomea]